MSKYESVALRILEDFRHGVISRHQAAELLGCSERAVTLNLDLSESPCLPGDGSEEPAKEKSLLVDNPKETIPLKIFRA